jgi:hypothetical protein
MLTSAENERIMEVRVTDDELVVAFVDGRTLTVPLVFYPRLFHATPEQRSEWRLIGDGDGVHWPQIDEDLSAAGLLRGVSAPAHRELSQPEGSGLQVGYDTVKGPIHVTRREGGWAVIREGNEKASSVHPTQREAEQKGRQIARTDKTEFFLHNKQGQIRERDSYSHERQDEEIGVRVTDASEVDVGIREDVLEGAEIDDETAGRTR